MSFNLPNPSLLGILLAISTHSGPQLVYKYPTNLHSQQQNTEKPKTTEETIDSDEDDELYEYKNNDDELDDQNGQESLVNEITDDKDLYGITNENWDIHHLNYYMGTRLDLRRFLDQQDDRREQQRKNKKQQQQQLSHHQHQPLIKTISKSSLSHSQNSLTSLNKFRSINDEIFGIGPSYLIEMLAPPKTMCNTRFEMTIEGKIFLGLPIHKNDDGTWKNNNKTISPIKNNLNMFHLVFIMNPPIIENNYRIDEMFQHVVSKISLVLRHAQSKHDYIGQQSKLIQTIREQGDDEITLIEKSSLCKMIFDCYTAISNSKVANLLIDGKIKSFQIPIKTEFHSLPDPTVPYIPGSYLSSTVKILSNNGIVNVGEASKYGQQLKSLSEEEEDSDEIIIYFALLLLDEPENIIRDIKTSTDSILAKFIRMIQPTESLLKLSLRNTQLDIRQIKSFAFHLIYWRRARIIQPLSSRSVYIISPMAPLTIKLYDDITEFNIKFPTLPSLPHFLKLLSPQSKKPQQFAAIIPSRDHRDSYLQALAWLNRFGYVTQQLTFIWLKISRKIKIKVEEDIENENLAKKRKNSNNTKKEVIVKTTDNSSKQKESSNTFSKKDLNTSTTSSNIEKLKEQLNQNNSVSLLEEDDTIILDPGRASTLERKWINEIIFNECKLSNELIKIFYKLLKYMNGKSPLELILLKDNVSRNELKKLLFAIEDYIISVRHW
ncbi:NPR3 [Candida pseudojiufengensis]|uniref:NPR3 n=1 Tax=Candida pseudojiufengensis TaxID=497109 RepID=UPI002224AEA9|nr:NPR3 [Candida pseudojiufengensis]KAI5962633.1 NPR3 [Candida pseudojiufengensis]